jgi:hypothetical protein
LNINVPIVIVLMPFLYSNVLFNVKDNRIFIFSINGKNNFKLSSEDHKLINFVLKNNSWPFIKKGKNIRLYTIG